jgi:hypothetical protein
MFNSGILLLKYPNPKEAVNNFNYALTMVDDIEVGSSN